ncbi:MAG TPA: hypothetical protein VNO25_11375, partial [Streptosporangiaceae bacterium]|nr:hypothetical protein [Streptosporangiaceae bacterium]
CGVHGGRHIGLLPWIDELLGPVGGRIGLAGFDLSDRDQRQAQVADFLEQAMQRGLVGYRAADDGGAVVHVDEAKSVKPGSPPGIKVPFEADFVPLRAVMRAGRYFAHLPSLQLLPGWMDLSRRFRNSLVDRKVEGNVMRTHHHVWWLMW